MNQTISWKVCPKIWNYIKDNDVRKVTLHDVEKIRQTFFLHLKERPAISGELLTNYNERLF